MLKPLLYFQNVSIIHQDNLILSTVSQAILSNSKIGLIGANGSGKTSLLKAISQQIKPSSGAINVLASVAYVPQFDEKILKSSQTIQDCIMEKLENWWDVSMHHSQIFRADLKLDSKLSSLSGGEVVKLNIAIAASQLPDVLLLDEPTNHLDLDSINNLQNWLKAAKFAYVVVSHNQNFLNEVAQEIWAIENKTIQVYGGNYDFYKDEAAKKREAIKQEYQSVKKQLDKKKKILQKTAILYQKKQSKINKIAKSQDRSTSRGIIGATKQGYQENFGLAKKTKELEISSSIQKLKELEQPKRKAVVLTLNAYEKKGLILKIRDGKLRLPTGKILLEKIDFELKHGDRVAILGRNGSGKTTFTKQFEYQKAKLPEGKISYGANYTTAFVDQKYNIVNTQETLLQNVQKAVNGLTYENARRALGNLNFFTDEQINKKAGTLSGGELARLAFAKISVKQIDLLILDEPTNNLDIDTIDIIAEYLKEYKGTLVVISHDLSFLEKIEVKTFWEVKEGRLDMSPVHVDR